MRPLPTISISSADFIDSLPLERGIFYRSLLAAVADEATELRFEPGGDFGRVWYTVGGMDYELVPASRDDVEQEVMSLSPRNHDVRFQLVIRGKATDVRASVEGEKLIFRFLDPGTASKEACEIADQMQSSNQLSRRDDS